MRRLLTLLRYLPREGAFFSAIIEELEKENEPVVVKRQATAQEMAALFGIPMA